MNVVLKKRSSAVTLIVSGLLLTLLYKAFKYYLRNSLGFDPSDDYKEYEFSATIFRVFTTICSFTVIFWNYKSPKDQFKLNTKLLGFILILFPVVFAAIKISFFGWPDYHQQNFVFELPVNFFTGTSEEFVFRGMIFVGLTHFINLRWSVFVTALYFALFHLDVTTEIVPLLALFAAGLFLNLAFYKGATLLSLLLVHFLYDQIHYGFYWPVTRPLSYDYGILLADIGLVVCLLFFNYSPPLRTNTNRRRVF